MNRARLALSVGCCRAPLIGVTLSCLSLIPHQSLHTQVVTYYVGLSSSWGEESGIMCTDSDPPSCSKGSISSAADFVAPTAGLGLKSSPLGLLQFETGVILAPRGWRVTTPTFQTVYLEVPLLIRFGYWPRSDSEAGGGLLGGVAVDLGVMSLNDSDLAFNLGFEFQVPIARAGVSLGLRYGEGLNSIYGFRNHSVVFLLGISPARDR